MSFDENAVNNWKINKPTQYNQDFIKTNGIQEIS